MWFIIVDKDWMQLSHVQFCIIAFPFDQSTITGHAVVFTCSSACPRLLRDHQSASRRLCSCNLIWPFETKRRPSCPLCVGGGRQLLIPQSVDPFKQGERERDHQPLPRRRLGWLRTASSVVAPVKNGQFCSFSYAMAAVIVASVVLHFHCIAVVTSTQFNVAGVRLICPL
jgi:hypothetical protein